MRLHYWNNYLFCDEPLSSIFSFDHLHNHFRKIILSNSRITFCMYKQSIDSRDKPRCLSKSAKSNNYPSQSRVPEVPSLYATPGCAVHTGDHVR